MEEIKREVYNNFNEMINNQTMSPHEVCMFIYGMLHEKGYVYRPTGCYGEEWPLKDGQ